MRIYILGVCGKLMAGVAKLAVQLGYEVIGYDKQYSQPMKSVLDEIAITCHQGYPPALAIAADDQVIVGNGLRASEPLIQDLIAKKVRLYSAPEWLRCFVLLNRTVIAVTGSHGKTTISAMIAYMLTTLGLNPGYLVGGVIPQLKTSAHLGHEYFIIEADEYDAAFFDKRPKFHHYWPTWLVISDLEFDHADIFEDFKAIIKEFRYLLRLIPKTGGVIATNLPLQLTDQIQTLPITLDQYQDHQALAEVLSTQLQVVGEFNQRNAYCALQVGLRLGLNQEKLLAALATYQGCDRRQTLMKEGYIDDFAHHPTAVRAMIQAYSHKKLIVVYHPATYTQRMGIMDQEAILALKPVHQAILLVPKQHKLDLNAYESEGILLYYDEVSLAEYLLKHKKPSETVLVMSAYFLADFWFIVG